MVQGRKAPLINLKQLKKRRNTHNRTSAEALVKLMVYYDGLFHSEILHKGNSVKYIVFLVVIHFIQYFLKVALSVLTDFVKLPRFLSFPAVALEHKPLPVSLPLSADL